MNTRILQKCLDELKKDSPNVDYLRGMLETLVEMGDQVVPARIVIPEDAKVEVFTAPSAVKKEEPVIKVVQDPAGDMETTEQRKTRLGKGKVPPAFLGDIRRMHLDPAKTDGKTDVTPAH